MNGTRWCLGNDKCHWDYFLAHPPSSLPGIPNDLPVIILETLPVLHSVPSFVFLQGQDRKKAQDKIPRTVEPIKTPLTKTDRLWTWDRRQAHKRALRFLARNVHPQHAHRTHAVTHSSAQLVLVATEAFTIPLFLSFPLFSSFFSLFSTLPSHFLIHSRD